MTILEWIAAGLLVAGALWMLLGTVGLLRFPDLFTRLHATGMTATLGIGLILLGTLVYFGARGGVGLRLLAALVFLFLTGPVGTHLLFRSAYLAGVTPWEGTIRDDLGRARQLGDMQGRAGD